MIFLISIGVWGIYVVPSKFVFKVVQPGAPALWVGPVLTHDSLLHLTGEDLLTH